MDEANYNKQTILDKSDFLLRSTANLSAAAQPLMPGDMVHPDNRDMAVRPYQGHWS
jgi:hypothetical protein